MDNTKPIEVMLPTCPVCGAVGKLPGHSFSGRWTCQGATTKPHIRKSMVQRKFREVVEA